MFVVSQKAGKVVLVLAGRFAGKKAIVLRTTDDSTASRKFPHATVVGMSRSPRQVTKAMSKKKMMKRATLKPFIKTLNHTHIMPTRYVVDMDLRKLCGDNITDEQLKGEEGRAAKKLIKKTMEERYQNQKESKSEKKIIGTSYFFKKLAF